MDRTGNTNTLQLLQIIHASFKAQQPHLVRKPHQIICFIQLFPIMTLKPDEFAHSHVSGDDQKSSFRTEKSSYRTEIITVSSFCTEKSSNRTETILKSYREIIGQFAPRNYKFVPGHGQIVPKNYQNVPRNLQIVPGFHQIMPRNHQVMPRSHQIKQEGTKNKLNSVSPNKKTSFFFFIVCGL